MRPELTIPCGVLVLSLAGICLALLGAKFRWLEHLSVFDRYRRTLEQLRGAPEFDSPESIRQMRNGRLAGWMLAAISIGLLVTWIVSLSEGRLGLARATGEWGAVLLPVSVVLILGDIYNRRYMARHYPRGASAHVARPNASAVPPPSGPALWAPLAGMALAVIAMGLVFRSWQMAAASAAVMGFFCAPFAVAYVRARRRVSGR